MAFKYHTMQSFVKNTIQPHIVNVKDLLKSYIKTLADDLIKRLDDLRKEMEDKIKEEISLLKGEINEKFIDLTNKFNTQLSNLKLS